MSGDPAADMVIFFIQCVAAGNNRHQATRRGDFHRFAEEVIVNAGLETFVFHLLIHYRVIAEGDVGDHQVEFFPLDRSVFKPTCKDRAAFGVGM